MPVGLQVFGDSGYVQIDSTYKNSSLIIQGTCTHAGFNGTNYYGMQIQMPYDIRTECPLVLVRSGIGKYVGGMYSLGPHSDNGSGASVNGEIILIGQSVFDYAIFSTRGTPIRDTGKYGIEIFNEAGSMVFTSADRHPRILEIFRKDAEPWGYPKTYVTSKGSIPWILANPLVTTWKGVGEFTEVLGGVVAANNGDGTFTVNMMDTAGTYPITDSNQFLPNYKTPGGAQGFNPYSDMPAFFAICDFA